MLHQRKEPEIFEPGKKRYYPNIGLGKFTLNDLYYLFFFERNRSVDKWIEDREVIFNFISLPSPMNNLFFNIFWYGIRSTAKIRSEDSSIKKNENK